jgi:hypothetical protein
MKTMTVTLPGQPVTVMRNHKVQKETTFVKTKNHQPAPVFYRRLGVTVGEFAGCRFLRRTDRFRRLLQGGRAVSPDSTCLCGCGMTRQRFIALMAHPHVAARVWEDSQAQVWGTAPAQACSLSALQ